MGKDRAYIFLFWFVFIVLVLLVTCFVEGALDPLVFFLIFGCTILAFSVRSWLASTFLPMLGIKNAEAEELQRRKDELAKERAKAEQQAKIWREHELQEMQKAEAKRLAEKKAEEEAAQERMRLAEEINRGEFEARQGSLKQESEERFARYTAYKSCSRFCFFVKVCFSNGSKTYDYICDDDTVQEGSYVYVDGRYGPKRALVVKTFYAYLERMPLPADAYKTAQPCDDKYEKDASGSNYPKRNDGSKWDGYCVGVKFRAAGSEYSYRCPFPNVKEGDFVLVMALGKLETVKVDRTFYDQSARGKMVLGMANEKQIEKVFAKFADSDGELSWEEDEEEEEEFALELEEEERLEALEEEELEDLEGMLDCPEPWETNLPNSEDDDWTPSRRRFMDDFDEGVIFDSRGNMVNGKLQEYDRRLRAASRTGFASNGLYVVDTEYRYELMDGYRYCDDHEEYDDCHYGHDDDFHHSDSFDDSYDSDSYDSDSYDSDSYDSDSYDSDSFDSDSSFESSSFDSSSFDSDSSFDSSDSHSN